MNEWMNERANSQWLHQREPWPGAPRRGVCSEHFPICMTLEKLPNVFLVPSSVKWGRSMSFPRVAKETKGDDTWEGACSPQGHV